MPVPADYLDADEKAEMQQLDADHRETWTRYKLSSGEFRAIIKANRAKAARLKARGVHRMEAARVATEARK